MKEKEGWVVGKSRGGRVGKINRVAGWFSELPEDEWGK